MKYFYTLTVNKNCDCENDYCDCEPTISFKETTLEELKIELAKDGWGKKEDILLEFKKTLDRKSKVNLEKEFYYKDGAFSLDKINLENISTYYVDKLARGACLLQKVSITSLKEVAPEVYKAYQQAKKRVEISRAKRKATAEKRKATKKKKELEKAKALLKKAGGEL